MARVGVDLDGVLYDFGAAFREFLVRERSWEREWCPDPQRWEFYEDWGLSAVGFINLCNVAADRDLLWRAQEPIGLDAPAESLGRLREAGHTIHIITNRTFGSHPGCSQASTATWLNRWNIPYDTLTFSADKTIIKTDYFIEDNADNYEALNKAGCRAVLMDAPWNRHVEGAVRVSSIAGFVEKVLDGELA